MMKLMMALTFSLFVVACGSKGGDSGSAATTTVATTGLSGIDNSCIAGGTINNTVCNNSVYGQYAGWAAYPNNYNLQSAYQNGVYSLCGCGPGMIPAYGIGTGMGCVQYNLVPTTAYQWSLGAGYNWAFAQSTFSQSSYYNQYSSNYYGNYDRRYNPRIYRGMLQYGFGNGAGGYGFWLGSRFVSGSQYNSGYAPTGPVNIQQIPGTTNVYNYNGNYNCSNSTAVQSCFTNQNNCGNGAQCIPTQSGSPIGICANSTTATNYSVGGSVR